MPKGTEWRSESVMRSMIGAGWNRIYALVKCIYPIRYIKNQQKHHLKRSFREEYIELLEKFNVDFDQRYIFKMDDE